MARPTLEDIRHNIGDAMVSNLWSVAFVRSPFALSNQGTFIDQLNFRAVSAEVPKRTGNSLEITIRGHKVKQPGDYDYSGQITLTLVESDANSPVHPFIRAWREAIIGTNTGYQAPKGEIETEVILTRLNRQNGIQTAGATTWTLVGAFLEDYELGEMTETGDIIQPTITLSYDYFYEGSFANVQLNPEFPTVEDSEIIVP